MQQSVFDTDVAVERFASIVADLDDPLTILEFGACDGSHTKLLTDRLEGRDYRYFAFEPDPRQWVAFGHAVPPHGEAFQLAIGAHDGSAPFHLSSGPGYYGSSSLKTPKLTLVEWPEMRFDETIEVQVRRLDTFAEEFLGDDIVDFIWSDIQGAEGDMIARGQETLARTRWLYTEADGNGLYEGDVNADEICALLPDWKSHGRVGGDLLLENTNL